MTRILLVAFLLTACTSPYEQGLGLGREHAEKLREGELTFEQLTRDLDRADRESKPTDRDEFERGYSEAIQPVRKELTKLVAAELTKEALGQLGFTAQGIVDGVRESLDEGGIDRQKVRAFGKKVGHLLRDLSENAEELHQGIEEGLEEKR